MADLQQKLIDDRNVGSSANSNAGFLINDTTEHEKDLLYNTGNISSLMPRKVSNAPSPILGNTVTSLADLKGQNLDELLNTEQMQEEMMKPFSTRIKIVIEYD